MKEVTLIFIGWLLGILGPGIVDRISNQYKKKAIHKTILNELIDLKKRLALLPFYIFPKYGKLDEKIFIWTREQTKDFKDFKEFKINNEMKDVFEKQVKNPENLNKFIALYNQTHKKEKPGFHFKKMEASVIDSNIINFGLLEEGFLEKLLEIKFQLNAFNEEIQSSNEYMKMTFDSNISVINHQIISQEIENKNLTIAEKAIYIVGKINNILDFKQK